MRDLKVFDELPTRSEIRARIPPGRTFRPEPRVVKPIGLRARDDGYTDVLIEGRPPRRVHPMVAEAHRLLEQRVPFEEIVLRVYPMWEHGRPKLVSRLLRSYFLDLYEIGALDIPFDEPPAVFGGRFERVELLGRGGMGLVYLCRDLDRGGAPVVLKHSWGWSSNIESADLMNRREAAALSVLDHPLIPRLVHVFEVDGILHLAREYAEGKPLLSFAAKTKTMPTRERLAIARDACAAIHHIHERGLLYLDVKPENYLYSPADGRARLIDLGLCRPAGESGQAKMSSPAGSRGYAAPEAVFQLVASRKADIYGLGRLLFFLASGARPRTKWTGEELEKRLLDLACDPREAALVARMAAEDPARRPESLAEVLAEMDDIIGDARHER